MGIKDTAIVMVVILIIFLIITVIESDELSFGFIIFLIATCVFLLLIDFFQCKIFIEVSGESLLLPNTFLINTT